MQCQWGGKNPQNCPFPWDFVILPVEDRAMGIGNIHKNLVKIVHVAPDVCLRTDRQTDTHTQTCSSQYFSTAPTGEVMIFFEKENSEEPVNAN